MVPLPAREAAIWSRFNGWSECSNMTAPANYCSCHERREGQFLTKWETPAMTCARADAGVGRSVADAPQPFGD